MSKHGAETILAYPYAAFPLLELHIGDYRVSERATPPDFAGAFALSGSYDNVVFYAPYINSTLCSAQ